MTIRISNAHMRGARAALAAVAVLLAALPALAQDYEDRENRRAPAVSEPHFVGELGARFIGIDHVDARSAAGGTTFYLPVGNAFGFALGGEVGLGSVEGDLGEVLSAHAGTFWRNPEAGYAGLAVNFDHISSYQRVHVSAVGGSYLGEVDLLAGVGYDGGDGPGLGLFELGVGYYTSSRLRIGAGIEIGTDETVSGNVRLHWQPADDSPVTLHADAGGGEFDNEGFYSAGFGITISFSDAKSLMGQLRHDRLLIFDRR